MEDLIKIGDFVKLTGSTLKTVIYYHKIGLLQEPKRSAGGYRLYGPTELTRMQIIKRLKALGMDLARIKDILGESHNQKTLREVLESLHTDLQNDKKNLEDRIAKIELLLSKDEPLQDEEIEASPSFQMITEILSPEQVANYAEACPELFTQQQKIFGIIDDFKWGDNFQDTFRTLAEYFQTNPEQYQISLDFGRRLSALSQLSEDDPEIEILARESTDFIKKIPPLKELLCSHPGINTPLEGLYNNMVATVYSPARMKHMQLFQKYLALWD